MRKLASIVQIATSDPIPDSDKLSVVTMEGKAWRIVTGRDEFHTGDIAVYFEIDSALPVDDERYNFLHERCLRTWRDKKGREVWKQAVRIRTLKLRGVISQGLLMPIASFPELANKAIGEDATDILRVEHYDEICAEMQARLASFKQANPGKQAGNFPAAVPKTDEERCVSGDTVLIVDGKELTIANALSAINSGKCASVVGHDVSTGKSGLYEILGSLISPTKSKDEWFEIKTKSGKCLKITGNSRVWLPAMQCYRRVDSLTVGDLLYSYDG